MKRINSKKKKEDETLNGNLKCQGKLLKHTLKNTFSIFIPKPNLIHSPSKLTPKPSRSALNTPKHIRSALNTPKHRPSHQNTCLSNVINKVITPSSTLLQPSLDYNKLSRKNYKFVFQIGEGGFGRVWKVQHLKTKEILAMKEISKAKVIMKKSVHSILNEKQLLSQLNGPFIINIRTAFQDRQYLYLGMEYLRGGDLRYHLCFQEYFDEQQTRFIVACIILALENIHSKGVIHRDLKPQNLVFEENGYLRLTDFGVARKLQANNSQETSGTPGYMAPEVICRMNHSFQADFFALGVIIHQLMLGTRPYVGDSRKQIRDKILAHQARVCQEQLPPGWSQRSIDFVNRLLKRSRDARLGFRGIHELKEHSWMKPVPWKRLFHKELRPPFAPGPVCQSALYQKEMEYSCASEVNEQTTILLQTEEIQKLFSQYSFEPKRPKYYRS